MIDPGMQPMVDKIPSAVFFPFSASYCRVRACREPIEVAMFIATITDCCRLRKVFRKPSLDQKMV